jgi:hypothetical protein
MKRIFIFIVVVFLLFSLTTTEAMAQGRMSGQASGCCGSGGHGGGERGCCHQIVSDYEPGCQGYYSRPRAREYEPGWLEPEIYRPVALETVSGEVIDVYQMTARRGRGYGLHLLLRTSDRTIDVHLGPTRYLENEDFRIERGSSLEVKGEQIPTEGLPAMTAFEVKQGDDVLALRDEDGTPLWRG